MFMGDCITDRQSRNYARIPEDTDILITHSPAYGILDFDDGINYGSEEILERLPSLPNLKAHLFGHMPEIAESDIVYETCRSGGKGGQNVNKVETTVRAIHIPSGIAAKCSDERSQSQNKACARERLLLKLRQQNDKAQADSLYRQWINHDKLERGNPVRKFSGPL